MMSSKQNALEIRELYFNYKNGIQVLNRIDVTVPKGKELLIEKLG